MRGNIKGALYGRGGSRKVYPVSVVDPCLGLGLTSSVFRSLQGNEPQKKELKRIIQAGSIFKAQNVPHGDLEPELPCTMNAASRQLYTAAQDFTVARDAAMASADAACLLTLLGFEGLAQVMVVSEAVPLEVLFSVLMAWRSHALT